MGEVSDVCRKGDPTVGLERLVHWMDASENDLLYRRKIQTQRWDQGTDMGTSLGSIAVCVCTRDWTSGGL